MKEKLLFIGLVDTNQIKGDSNHFRKLTSYMSSYCEVFIASFTNKVSDTHFKIKFPKKALYRIVYWNLYLAYLIFLNYKKNNISKVYFRESGLVLSPYLICWFLNIKLYIEINGVTADDLPMPKNISTYLFKNFYKLGTGFVASRGYSNLIYENYNIPSEKIHQTNLGFDFIKDISELSISKFPIKTIVFIGNVVEYQGLDLFLDAYYKYVKCTNSKVQFLIVGDGPQLQDLRHKVNDMKLGNYVKFIAPIMPNELSELLLKCHVGISPFSNKRGKQKTISALKTYDYLNARLPILTSEMDEMSDFVIKENIGEVINCFTMDEIYKKLIICLDDVFLQKVKSEYDNKFEKFSETFSWERRFSFIKQIILTS